MTRRHTSFLVRCWDLGGDGERIEIEHVQTGAKVVTRSLDAALEWICESDRRSPVPTPDVARSPDDEGGDR